MPDFMVRGFAGAVKPGGPGRDGFGTVQDTLLLRDPWFSHIREKPGVGGAALDIVHSGHAEAQLAIYSVSDVGGVLILLSIVLPPAHRT